MRIVCDRDCATDEISILVKEERGVIMPAVYEMEIDVKEFLTQKNYKLVWASRPSDLYPSGSIGLMASDLSDKTENAIDHGFTWITLTELFFQLNLLKADKSL